MATEQDAARDRVLEARSELAEEVQVLEASGRAAIDIPARVKRSPAKAAALAGGLGFLALKGPQRLFRGARNVGRGKPAELPDRMLPDEIEKALRKLGRDGDKVRGALERDFAAYAKQSQKDRKGLVSILLLAVARPLLERGAKAAGDVLFTPDPDGFSARLAEVRGRVREGAEKAREGLDQARDAAADGVDRARGAAGEGLGQVRDSARDKVAEIRSEEPQPRSGTGV